MLVVAGVVALGGAHAGMGAESASRIVDRTLLCRMTGVGYPDPARLLRIGAATYDAANSDLPSSISITNGGADSGTNIQIATGSDDQAPRGYVHHGQTTCSATSIRIPLSRRSLSGGPIPFSKSFDCDVSPRILVRVQGIFERPPRLTRDGASGDLVHGYLAVATFPDRKPIVFTSIGGGSQQTKVFVSATRCKED